MGTRKEGPDLQKLGNLLTQFQIEHEKTGDIIREMVELLGGGAGIALAMAAAVKTFDEMWTARYKSAYVWTHTTDKPNLKRLIKSLGPVELERRIIRYLTSAEPFLLQRRHPFGILVTTINSYAEAGAAAEFELTPAAAEGCQHLPRCSSDAQHTERRSRELRTVGE